MGLLYVPEKKVTVGELMFQQLDVELITKVRAGGMLHIGHVMAVLLKSGDQRG